MRDLHLQLYLQATPWYPGVVFGLVFCFVSPDFTHVCGHQCAAGLDKAGTHQESQTACWVFPTCINVSPLLLNLLFSLCLHRLSFSVYHVKSCNCFLLFRELFHYLFFFFLSKDVKHLLVSDPWMCSSFLSCVAVLGKRMHCEDATVKMPLWNCDEHFWHFYIYETIQRVV